MGRAAEPGPGRLRGAIAWTGAGLLVGALLLVVGTVLLNWGAHEGGLVSEAGSRWILSTVIAGLALTFGIRWYRRHPRVIQDDPGGPAYAVWMSIFTLAGAAIAWAGFPTQAFEATATDGVAFDPSPAAVNMWIVAVAVASGCLCMLVSVHSPKLRPRRRSLPFAAAGALTVVLIAGLTAVVVFPREPHTVATDPGEPEPVPARVSRIGWSWEPPLGTEIHGVRAGAHGPIVLITDGAVALDGTTGEELWSYRRPLDHARRVGADGRGVYVRYAPGPDTGERVTVTLDAVTGEIRDRDPDVVPLAVEDLLPAAPGRADRLTDALGVGPDCFPSEVERYGDHLVGLLGCAEEDRGREERFDDPFTWSDTEVRVVLGAMDLTTGEEAWRQEWTVRSPGDSTPHLVDVRAGREEPVAVLSHGPDQVLSLLDPATGEEAVELPSGLSDQLSTNDLHRSLVQVDSGGVVFVEEGEDALSFHRANAAGETTDTAVVDGMHVIVPSRAVVLDDTLLVPKAQYESNEDAGVESTRDALFTASFGETVDRDSAQWITPGGPLVVDVVPVPGAVVVLTGGELTGWERADRLDGLVP
ncbi:putative pyrroloquinoline-quinone binding quinoprotein [Nocardiopsis sp. Huas11]|uniref:PQQ-binding-like beta-propeller repeat protein n=1 Tax=Nocardiopsis sp. Huas11 TaxID=2183912 RepID=UPI000EB3164E|nr:PQQ-binding-like beta-propeller repeat protein [Nocardiopsis sp. Huas11]RKS09732.1 putative pyrroloquinoline-quinone binding quinoprotein [Nocardiopsis sp. Huas11]